MDALRAAIVGIVIGVMIAAIAFAIKESWKK